MSWRFLSGNKVHSLQRMSYKEPVEEKVVYRFPSSITRDVRKVAGSSPSGNEDSAESDGQVASEWEDDPMDVDEVDPCYDPMDVEPWNWNLDWTHDNEQFNSEFVLPRTNFVSSRVALRGAMRIEEEVLSWTLPDLNSRSVSLENLISFTGTNPIRIDLSNIRSIISHNSALLYH